MLSDRTSIASGRLTPSLSPQELVSCDASQPRTGCQGNSLRAAWNYLQQTVWPGSRTLSFPRTAIDMESVLPQGVVSENCLPYTSGGGDVPACPNACSDSEPWASSKTYAKTQFVIPGMKKMKQDMMNGGPIQVTMSVSKSFFSYKSGVYEVPPGDTFAGYHAVKMLGWGNENGKDYWLVANSWGTTWSTTVPPRTAVPICPVCDPATKLLYTCLAGEKTATSRLREMSTSARSNPV